MHGRLLENEGWRGSRHTFVKYGSYYSKSPLMFQQRPDFKCRQQEGEEKEEAALVERAG